MNGKHCGLTVDINGTEIIALCTGRLTSKKEFTVFQRQAGETQEIHSWYHQY
jgi:hypothetical protein